MMFRYIIAILIILFNSIALADNLLTAKEIVKKSDQVNRAPYELMKVQMTLFDDGAVTSKRDIVWYLRNDNGQQTALFKFVSPVTIKDEGIRVEEQSDGKNLIWEYSPATRNIRRIPGEHKQNRFMGTEMVFEDFEGFKVNQSIFKLMGEAGCGNGHSCYVIESMPATDDEKQSSGYSKKIYYIDKDHFYLIKTSLFDKQQKLIKDYELQGYQNTGGFWRPTKYIMTNLQAKRATTMQVVNREINKPFDSYYISQRFLRSE